MAAEQRINRGRPTWAGPFPFIIARTEYGDTHMGTQHRDDTRDDAKRLLALLDVADNLLGRMYGYGATQEQLLAGVGGGIGRAKGCLRDFIRDRGRMRDARPAGGAGGAGGTDRGA